MAPKSNSLVDRIAKACLSAICLHAATADAVDPADVAFAFSDGTGTMLLALGEDNLQLSPERALTFVQAVCSESQIVAVRYLWPQPSGLNDTHRDTAGNFANVEGQLYEIVEGAVEPSDACLLLPAGYLAAFPVLPNEFPRDERDRRRSEYYRLLIEADDDAEPDLGAFHASTEFARQSLGRLAAARDRPVELYWLLHRNGAREVAAVEFAAVGDGLLGSLAVVEAENLAFFDMPASLEDGRRGNSCWKVDDGCRFGVVGMSVPAVLEAPGGPLVFFTFGGAESQSLVLFEVRDGQVVELRRAGRYWAPM